MSNLFKPKSLFCGLDSRSEQLVAEEQNQKNTMPNFWHDQKADLNKQHSLLSIS